VRRLLGLDRYKPTEEEISRFLEELRLYERSVGDSNIMFQMKN